ncbi:MAG: hypothetical protein N4A40_15555 [Tissierellales bacterium]|jgi:hypothetical protein|nr:hypothetical protein [Tissierellales bacterium]
MKKIFKILIVIMLFACLVGCADSEVKKTVENCLNAYKTGDILLAESYMTGIENENLMELGQKDLDLFSEAFTYLEYEITGVDVESKSAKAKVKIKVKDMPKANGMLIDEIFRLSLKESKSGFDIEAELKNLYEKFLLEVGYVEAELDVELVKEDDKWKIKPNYDFKNKITGGLYSSVGIKAETDDTKE